MYLLTLLNHQGKALAQYSLIEGQSKRVLSFDNYYYQLVDKNGLIPQGLQTSRQEDDLLVQISGATVLIIEDYFAFPDERPNNPFIVVDSNGVENKYDVDINESLIDH